MNAIAMGAVQSLAPRIRFHADAQSGAHCHEVASVVRNGGVHGQGGATPSGVGARSRNCTSSEILRFASAFFARAAAATAVYLGLRGPTCLPP